MTATEACLIVRDVLLRTHPAWTVSMAPMTDGGEGFCAILTQALHGEFEDVPVLGPQLQPQTARLGWVELAHLPEPVISLLKLPERGRLAIIEMAEASGLEVVPVAERTPWKASSYGVGQLIAQAVDSGATAIVLGVGGSATIDLGLGALEAIGFESVDVEGRVMTPSTPADWSRLKHIRGAIRRNLPPIYIACDVGNPLLGPEGAVQVFGQQKGLFPEQMPDYEAGLSRLAQKLCDVTQAQLGLMTKPGAGAAGGIPFGLCAACGAVMVSGYELVKAWLDLKKKISGADLILTGEGTFDASSLQGKGPGSLLKEAVHQGKPVHILAGLVEAGLPLPQEATAEAIAPATHSRERSIAEGKQWLARKVIELFPNESGD